MSDRNPHMNRLLISIAVFLCLICGLLFTQSSAGPSGNSYSSVVAENTENLSRDPATPDHVTSTDISATEEGASPSPTPSPVPTELPEIQKVSPEAKEGVWTADGSNWKFLVDGTAYTGWLTDTDGHRYYFDRNGTMRRGWITLGKKRYYLDEDGILQTGTITIDGKKYQLAADGSLKK